MIPVTITLQYLHEGVKNSASMRLSIDMTAREAVQGITTYLSLPAGSTYRLLRQRQLLEHDIRLFEAGVQEGDILQLTEIDSNTTIGASNLGRSMAGSLLSRLGGKAGDEPLPMRAALLTQDGRSFLLRHTRALIGRADERVGYPPESFDVELTAMDNDRTVSRPHAMIVYAEGCFTVRDLYSQRGVQVNGQMISPSQVQAIKDGDILTIGDVVLQFRCETK